MQPILPAHLVLLIPILGIVTGICATVGHYWRDVRKAELDAELKRLMIERGMSAAEILSVLDRVPRVPLKEPVSDFA